MGFRQREQLIPEAVREQIAAHGRGRYEGPAGVRLLIVDGVAAGLWELTRAQRAALDEEAGQIGTFTGLEPVLEVG